MSKLQPTDTTPSQMRIATRLSGFALFLVVVMIALAGAVRAAPPVDGALSFASPTANPAVATLEMGVYTEALVQLTADAGAHTVTVYTRTCPTASAACSWVDETTLGGSYTGGSTVHQFRVTGAVRAVRVSVTNAGGNTVSGTYLKSGAQP